MLHALCNTLQGCSQGNRSGCPAPAGDRRPALPWQARAGQWLHRSGDIERHMKLSDGCHFMHGGKSLDRRLSVRLQTSKRSNDTGSAAELPAKRKKLLSGRSGPSSAPSGKRHALSGASSSGCHPVEAPIAAAAGPLSGLHLKFWRLNHSKQLHDQVPDSCNYLLDVEPDSFVELDTAVDVCLSTCSGVCNRRRSRVQSCRMSSARTRCLQSWSR